MNVENDRQPHFPPEALHQSAEDIAYLRSLTMKERGDMLISACRAAAKLLEARARSGLPAPQPAPWPASTVEFLKKWASNVRRNT
ncbi:MAG: hypothetical protein KY476_14100 [Planctomycetes bacterium]|nr:hypothetical protein [Planctomycetota bacterium]